MKNTEVCGFHSRFHTWSIFAPPEKRHTSFRFVISAFACPLALWPEKVLACRVSLSSVSSGCAKLLLVESRFLDLFFVTISLGIARFFYKHSTVSSDIFFRPDPFLLHKQPCSLNFLCHVQICFAVGDCLGKSVTNVCYTVLFNCERAYSNTKRLFSMKVTLYQ